MSDHQPSRAEVLATLTAPGEPFELVASTVYGRECRFFKHAPETLRDLFADNVSDLDFLVYEDERLTFAEAYLKRRGDLVRCELQRRKVIENDVKVAAVQEYAPKHAIHVACQLSPPI